MVSTLARIVNDALMAYQIDSALNRSHTVTIDRKDRSGVAPNEIPEDSGERVRGGFTVDLGINCYGHFIVELSKI